MPNHSITKIIHGGETLFENNEIKKSNSVGINGNLGEINRGNDNFEDVVTITLNNIIPEGSNQEDEIAIYYRIDGSCERINPYLAKCTKYYKQGQNIGQPHDHFPASNYFKLPYYADTTRLLTINVDGVPKTVELDYELWEDSAKFVRFFEASDTATDGRDFSRLQIFDGQAYLYSIFCRLKST